MPLALALLNVSDPGMTVMDTLSRLSHDTGERIRKEAPVLRVGGRATPARPSHGTPAHSTSPAAAPLPLSRADADVAMNAVLALGFIGAGTNNAR